MASRTSTTFDLVRSAGIAGRAYWSPGAPAQVGAGRLRAVWWAAWRGGIARIRAGACRTPAATLSRLVAAVPCPEGCPGTRERLLRQVLEKCARHGSTRQRSVVQDATSGASGPRAACCPCSSVAEHLHGKEGVAGSIPAEGSTKRSGSPGREPNPWRRSSVGQSIRLIIGRSSVQVRSPLPEPEHDNRTSTRTPAGRTSSRNVNRNSSQE